MKCEKCKKEYWLMRDSETPEEMIKRYQDNPDIYCREHRIPNFRIPTREQLIQHWALNDGDDDAIIVTEDMHGTLDEYIEHHQNPERYS